MTRLPSDKDQETRRLDEDANHANATMTPTKQATNSCRINASIIGVVLLANVGLAVYAIMRQTTEPDECPSQTRLPSHIIPKHYDLDIWPILNANSNSTLLANVTILAECRHDAKNITLHVSSETMLHSILLQDVTESTPTTIHVNTFKRCVDSLTGSGMLTLFAPVYSGRRYSLRIQYEAPLKKNLVGLYLSEVRAGRNSSMTTVTQMEPEEARKMLPCWDEPMFKSTFTVKIRRRNEHISLSNMPLKQSVPYDEQWTDDHFDKSLPMSTYLIALAVGVFESRVVTNEHGVTLAVYTPPHQIDDVNFSLAYAQDALDYLENFFGIKYPMPKCDMIAVAEFAQGAMENWGLITYRDLLLLYDDGVTTAKNLEQNAKVIAHELAHQWFGNLVTMEWWDELWLNEGFAALMEDIVVANTKPDWDRFMHYYMDTVVIARHPDAIIRSNPVRPPHIVDPADLFDPITYQKAANLMRMLKLLLGEKRFIAGLRQYIKTHAYGNAAAKSLWRHMQDTVDKENLLPANTAIADIMDEWIEKLGYPLVEVKLDDKRNILRVRQTGRFTYLKEPNNNGIENWPIPLSYRIDNNTETRIWLRDGMEAIIDLKDAEYSYILANVDSMVFMNVLYDDTLLTKFTAQFKADHEVLTPMERAMVIFDSYQHLYTGRLKIHTVLNLIDYVAAERNVGVWRVIIHILDEIEKFVIDDDELYEQFMEYASQLLKSMYDSVPWDEPPEEDHIAQITQGNILSPACHYRVAGCRDKARAAFEKWMKKERIPVNVQEVAVQVGIYTASHDEFMAVKERYLRSSNIPESNLILEGLTQTQNVGLLRHYFNMTINGEIPPSVAIQVISLLASNRRAAKENMSWRFIMKHWNKLIDLTGPTSLLANAAHHTLQEMTTTQLREQAQSFLKTHSTPKAMNKVDQALEMIEANIQWREYNLPDLRQYLSKYRKN